MHKFTSIVKKEVLFYFITFIALTLLMHMDMITNPMARIEAMGLKENYSHPFIYTFFVYAVLLILRKVVDLIARIFEKKDKSMPK